MTASCSLVPKVDDFVRLRAGHAIYRVVSVYSRNSMIVAEVANAQGQSWAYPAHDLVVVDHMQAAGYNPAPVYTDQAVEVPQEDECLKMAEDAFAVAQAKLSAARAKAAEVKQAKADAGKAEAAKQKVLARVGQQIALAHATARLLRTIECATNEQDGAYEPSPVFAVFRKDLNPLAKTYGYHLVLIGSNKQAVLTKL